MRLGIPAQHISVCCHIKCSVLVIVMHLTLVGGKIALFKVVAASHLYEEPRCEPSLWDSGGLACSWIWLLYLVPQSVRCVLKALRGKEWKGRREPDSKSIVRCDPVG